ncbi:MAG: hypothetical protein COA88_13335, partial [Kordia sp.]
VPLEDGKIARIMGEDLMNESGLDRLIHPQEYGLAGTGLDLMRFSPSVTSEQAVRRLQLRNLTPDEMRNVTFHAPRIRRLANAGWQIDPAIIADQPSVKSRAPSFTHAFDDLLQNKGELTWVSRGQVFPTERTPELASSLQFLSQERMRGDTLTPEDVMVIVESYISPTIRRDRTIANIESRLDLEADDADVLITWVMYLT